MPMNDEKTLQLGSESVGRLLWRYALPAITAMVASSVYNVIAGIFIAHLGAFQIAGVGLAAPFMNLAAAFGALVGVGASVLCSIYLGEKNYVKARHVLSNLVILNLILGVLFTVFGLIFLDPILIFFGASDNTLAPAREYMQIILAGNVFAHMYLGLNSVMRVSGYPIVAMNLTLLSVAINIILAPIFIFLMDMGVRGAALATVIAQIVCCITLFVLFTKKDRPVYIDKTQFKPNAHIIARSFAIGSPNFFTNAAGCFVVIFQNYNLLKYGNDLHIGAFSIVNRVGFLFFMIVLGFSQGMQPIVAYNLGAKQYERMWMAFKLTLICALCVCMIGFLSFEFGAEFLTGIFVSGSEPQDLELSAMTVDAFHKVMAAFWIVAVPVIGANFLASMNQPRKSLFLSLTRQVIFMLPLLYFLPPIMGIDGVWWTTPISDIVAAICASVMIYHEYRRQKRTVWHQSTVQGTA